VVHFRKFLVGSRSAGSIMLGRWCKVGNRWIHAWNLTHYLY
jgi:hypothetical protein